MKLMKLVYIVHGWHLGIVGEDLFQNRIEAWKYGPVIPDLYHATKQFGRGDIPFDLIGGTDDNMNNQTSDFIDSVVKQYGDLSAFQLSALTHKSGSPWEQVYSSHKIGTEIPDSLITSHYKELYKEYEDTAAA